MGAPKVVIVNNTVWPTRMLRPFITRIAREEFDGTRPSTTRSRVTVTIGYNRGGKYYSYCSGWAYRNSSACTINVPYPHPGRTFPVMDFCHVVGHEFAHCRGLKHEDMGGIYGNSCSRGKVSAEHYAWAKALSVPVIVKKAAPSTADKRAKRLATAQAAVITWTRKRKLAETKLKLWSRKVRALEKLVKDPAGPLAAVAACGPIDVEQLSPAVVESEPS